jgi:hypothetical protein
MPPKNSDPGAPGGQTVGEVKTLIAGLFTDQESTNIARYAVVAFTEDNKTLWLAFPNYGPGPEVVPVLAAMFLARAAHDLLWTLLQGGGPERTG